jgi:hypothetical protein
MPTVQLIVWLVLAIAVLVGIPLMLVWTTLDYFRGKGSDRRGSGSHTSGIGAAMQELDRIVSRPSVEHQVETEHQTLRREDDAGSD